MVKYSIVLLLLIMMSCSAKPPLEVNFEDTKGNINSIADYLEEKNGMVMVFLSPECPLCQNYTVALRRLEKEYASREIPFAGVISGNFYSKEEVRRYKLKYDLEMDILYDPEFKLSEYYGATTTPEAVFIDTSGKLKYRGAIDNWAISLGKKRLNTTEHYLSDALDNFLTGNKINPRETKPVGCFIE